MTTKSDVDLKIKINIKNYFVFLAFNVKEESYNKIKALDESDRLEIAAQLKPCIYKKR